MFVVKLHTVPARKAGHHMCHQRAPKHFLCSDLVQLHWSGPDGAAHREIAILENLSRMGLGLFTGVPVRFGTEVQILVNGSQLKGQIRLCKFKANGYIVEVELELHSQWAQVPGERFVPEHLLDLSKLDLD